MFRSRYSLPSTFTTQSPVIRSHAVLAAIADELSRNGVHLIDSTAPISESLAEAGVMTRRQPSSQQRADIAFAWPLLSQTLRLDIGQAIAVRDRAFRRPPEPRRLPPPWQRRGRRRG